MAAAAAVGAGERAGAALRTPPQLEVITRERLGNGAVAVVEPMAEVRSVALGVWVGTGSRDEDDARAGCSHFLEHLLFKGTPTWSASEIAEAIDAVGGDMNAFTTKEYTAFYVRLLSDHLDLGVDILGSIMTDPALREHELEAERQVILDEILMHGDEPADVAVERLTEAMFPGHPLGREVLGTADSVQGLRAAEVRGFFEEHYRTGNMVLAAAGDLDATRLLDTLDARFSSRTGGRPPLRLAPGPTVGGPVVLPRDTEQAHLALGMRIAGRHAEERWAVAVLNHVLGGGLSSRLFQEVRERRGLAYSIWSDRTHFEEAGVLSIGAGTAPEHAPEVLELVHGILDDLGSRGVTARELEIAKGNLRADTLLSLEDSGARMSRLGASQLLHGEVLPVSAVLERIDAVTADEVAAVAAAVASAPRVLAVVGPFDPDAVDPVAGDRLRPVGSGRRLRRH